MAPRIRRQPAGSTASEICCRVGLASSSTASAYLQLAGLDGFARVLRRGDLACREADEERGDANEYRDTRDPQQGVGVALVQGVELGRRHVLDWPGGATQEQCARRLHGLDDD